MILAFTDDAAARFTCHTLACERKLVGGVRSGRYKIGNEQSPSGEPTDSAGPQTDQYERAVADLGIRQAANREVTDLTIERSQLRHQPEDIL